METGPPQWDTVSPSQAPGPTEARRNVVRHLALVRNLQVIAGRLRRNAFTDELRSQGFRQRLECFAVSGLHAVDGKPDQVNTLTTRADTYSAGDAVRWR